MPLISHATTSGCQFEHLIVLSERVLQVGMVFNLAEALTERHMAVDVHLLTGKEDHLVFQEKRTDSVDTRLITACNFD